MNYGLDVASGHGERVQKADPPDARLDQGGKHGGQGARRGVGVPPDFVLVCWASGPSFGGLGINVTLFPCE